MQLSLLDYLQEVLTSTRPYQGIFESRNLESRNIFALGGRFLMAVNGGVLPDMPIFMGTFLDVTYDKYIWQVCLQCWAREPADRPPMDVLAEEIGDIVSAPSFDLKVRKIMVSHSLILLDLFLTTTNVMTCKAHRTSRHQLKGL